MRLSKQRTVRSHHKQHRLNVRVLYILNLPYLLNFLYLIS